MVGQEVGTEPCSKHLSFLTPAPLSRGEAPGSLVLYLGCHLSLQIPRLDGEYDLKMPRDMAYVFGGAYVPLSCKIIEQVLERRGWQGLEEVVRLLNGNEFCVSDSAVEDNPAWESQRVVLAVFLGGCTFSEIAALRFLGKERGCKFIFLTTAITNSARMMEAMIEAKA